MVASENCCDPNVDLKQKEISEIPQNEKQGTLMS